MQKSILLWVVFSMSVFAWEWSEPELIAHDGGSKLAIDNQGVCWLTCGRSTYRFDEETSSWQKVTESDFYGGSACFDKGDTLWVFNGNFSDIYYVRFDGQTWSERDTVPSLPYENSPPIAVTDNTGAVWACWVRLVEVAYNIYKNGSWGEAQIVPNTPQTPGYVWGPFSAAADAMGRVWVGWGNSAEGMSIECRYNDNGTWSDQMSVRDFDTLYVESLDFAPDKKGGMWAVWVAYRYNQYTGEDSNYIEARHFKDGVWSDIDTVANAGILSEFPAPTITVDAYGRAWAVWRQALTPQDAYGDIYYSFNSGKDWSEPKPVDTNPAVDKYPDIAVDGAGRVWCVWSSNRDDSTGVWASYTMSTGVEEQAEAQTVTLVVQTITTTPRISYALPNGQSGSISIYDAVGRRLESRKVQGSGEVKFLPLTSGIYFVKLNTSQSTLIRKAVVLM